MHTWLDLLDWSIFHGYLQWKVLLNHVIRNSLDKFGPMKDCLIFLSTTCLNTLLCCPPELTFMGGWGARILQLPRKRQSDSAAFVFPKGFLVILFCDFFGCVCDSISFRSFASSLAALDQKAIPLRGGSLTQAESHYHT